MHFHTSMKNVKKSKRRRSANTVGSWQGICLRLLLMGRFLSCRGLIRILQPFLLHFYEYGCFIILGNTTFSLQLKPQLMRQILQLGRTKEVP